MPRKCVHKNCNKQPSCNYKGEKPKYCAEHKEKGMVSVIKRKCKHEGCSKMPVFNFHGETTGKYCVWHKEEGMIDVVSKRCKSEGCSKIPVFNFREETIGIYCAEHKEEGMVDVVHRRCKYEGCSRRPNYSLQGDTAGIYCAEHKEEGMVDVVHRRCKYEGCSRRASHNFQGETTGKYCAKHKEEGMVNVIEKRKCKYESCNKRPHFNYKEETIGKYCAEHKEEGMVDVIQDRCQHEGCTTQPVFNCEGETTGKYCKEHKEQGMINVVSRKCQNDGCKTQATYGILGNIPYHCAIHSDKRVEIFLPTRRCSRCSELATFGDEHPIRCETHALPEDRTFEISKCSKCGLQAIINREGICYCCDEYKHVRLAKQNETVAYLRAHNIPIESVDRIIDSDCGYERPDIVLNSNSGLFKIVVEVDEHQHKNYQELCTCVRMKNLAEMFFLPTLYIRFNPDEYKTPDLEEVPMKKRLVRLKQVLEKYMNMEKLGCTIGIIQLYFDGWVENTPTGITIIEQ
jgi:EsV-1-7 cysteine-rich motif